MKNDNKLVKFTVLVLLIAMVTLIVISGTYAKYTTTVSGTDSATIAKWSITVNNDEITTAEDKTVTFDLFNTIKDSNGTSNETDVTSTYIAPGTSGSFALVVKNTSDVTAKYTISFETTNDLEVPIEFSTDGGSTWKTSISDIDVASTTLAIGSDAKTTTVQWRWAFESGDDNSAIAKNDEADTAIGIAAQTASTLSVTATIAVEQVD